MKKATPLKVVLVVLFLIQSCFAFSQQLTPFATRYDKDLNGDILLIGNSILNRQSTAVPTNTPNVPYNGGLLNSNSDFKMNYINIDPAVGVFNSSSANLVLPDPTCSKVVYAALYWSAVTKGAESITSVKFKMPSGGYNDITGTVIYDVGSGSVGSSKPYACFADVTGLIQGLGATPASGTYTVANVSTAQGKNGDTGLSAGWSLFIVYENVFLPRKSITSFDGFNSIDGSNNLTINVSGFRAIPNGPVKAKFAFSAMEGDLAIGGDYLAINAIKMTPPERPPYVPLTYFDGTNWVIYAYQTKDNFFNSSVTSMGSIDSNRNPNSTNTLGFDAGVFEIDNPPTITKPGGSVIDNNATSAAIFLGSNQDLYFYYFTAFAIEVIAPDILLTKGVTDVNDVPAGNTDVEPNDELRYSITFQNNGNDDATNFTITDVLPLNVVFNGVPDLLLLPNGVTLQSYDSATRTVVFKIEDRLVPKKGGAYKIIFKVKVADCEALTDACSTIIKNIAYSKYNGVINPDLFGENSYSSDVGCTREPSSTNFLVGLDKCTLKETVSLCGKSIELKAPNGFITYTWKDPSGNIVGGNNQLLLATQIGDYVVTASGANPCVDIVKTFKVIDPLGSQDSNPINQYADNIDSSTGLPFSCVNNGKPFPKIFLCGLNDKRDLALNLTNVQSIVWQETTTISPTLPDSCPNETTAAVWSTVTTGATFTANRPGFFRVVINYTDVCLSTYYFNVYQNPLDPKATTRNSTCTTTGRITVTNPPEGTGYRYSLDGINYQDAAVFDAVAANSYTVTIKQTVPIATANSKLCEFKVDVTVLNQVFTTTVSTTDPYCAGSNGTIKVTANDVNKQYQFIVNKEGTTDNVGDTGLIDSNYYEFTGIAPGRYDVITTTGDGCYKKDVVEIFSKELKATAQITKSLTCENGEITIQATGGTPVVGTPPYYYYYVNGNTTPQTSPIIQVTKPLPPGGDFIIRVVDALGCSVTLPTITITEILKPEYTISKTEGNCSNDKASIVFNVTNANGYALKYSIDNGVTFEVNPLFSNLTSGTYNAVLQYVFTEANGSLTTCVDDAQQILLAAPANSLSASAGVAELAGCNALGQGKLRITNAEGGVLPYEYSFDGGVNWQTSNEKYVAPGTYILKVRDAKGCEFSMENIILDSQPTPPTISVDSSAFNCDGTATSTVTVTNAGSANYEYEYLIDGVVNPNPVDPKIFLNVSPGAHTITVGYKLINVSTYSNLLLETFGSGEDVASPGINPAFCFERQVEATKCNGDRLFGNGEYTVTNSLKNNPYSGWHNPIDHTSASAVGRYLAVDAGNAIPNNAVLYRKKIKDIIPNQPIQVKFFATNLLMIGNTQPNASLTVELQDTAGNALSSQSTGGIPKTNGWVEYNLTINPGNNTELDFVLRLEVAQANGIDFAVDDITVYQLPVACITKVDFPIAIPNDKKFTASVINPSNLTCATSADGKITVTAQNFNTTYGFDYSIDNGVNWINTKTSPVTVSNLTAQTYAIKIRHNATATSCTFDFSQPITAPTPVTVSASVVLPTCSTAATITAAGGGGTPSYQYELRDNNDSSKNRPFQVSNQFTNVPTGSYTVVARDSNMCISAVGADVTIIAPIKPTASLDTTVPLCYDGSTKVKLTVNVTAGTGTAPFSYTINTGQAPVNNTFEVLPGNYTITVTDAKGCTDVITGISIAAALNPQAILIKDLTCSNPTAAQIDVSIGGGLANFNYKVNYNSAGYGSAIAVVGNSFTYNPTAAGTYQFEITDAKNCSKQTKTITVNAPVAVTASATQVNPTCNGNTDGSITITALTGETSFTYSITGSTGSFVTSNVFGGLPAGTYNYAVKDSKGCIFNAPLPIVLVDPVAIVPVIKLNPILCNANTPGSIDLNVASGGIAPFTYKLYDNSFTEIATYTETAASATPVYTFAGLNFGDYYITIIDAKGCEFQSSKLRIETPPYLIFSGIVDSNNCATGVDYTVTTTGGTGPYRYSIFGQPDTLPTALDTYKFVGLIHGVNYFLQVKDANDCISILEVTMPAAPSTINITGTTSTNATCNASSSGTLAFTVQDFDPTVTDINYEILNALTLLPLTTPINGVLSGTAGGPVSGNITNLNAGNYVLQVKEVGGTLCSAAYTFTIRQPAQPLNSAITANVNATCSNPAQVTLTTTGGTGPYTYASAPNPTIPTVFNTGSNVLSLDIALGTNWNIIVKDANNCIVPLTVAIAKDPLPIIALAIADKCVAEGNFEIEVTEVTAGKGNYSISVDGGTFNPIVGLPHTVTSLNSGLHTISIKDANGCTDFKNITINVPLLVEPFVDLLPTCANNDGQITLTGSGGTGTYTYTITPNAGTITANVITGLPAGTYTVTMTDTTTPTNCNTTTAVTLIAPSAVTFTTTVTPTLCKGEANGSITVVLDATNNNPNYSYEITAGPQLVASQSSNVFTNLLAGNYTVAVTSGRGCTTTQQPVTIFEPAEVVVTAVTTTQFACNTGTNAANFATITVNNVTGGSGTYTLYEFFKAGVSVQKSTSNAYTEADYLGGSYTVNVYDDKGCMGTYATPITINPYMALDKISVTIDAAITCNNPESITANAVDALGNSIAGIQYTLTDFSGTLTFPSNTDGKFTGLTVGNYTITATNLLTGCSIQNIHYVTNPNTFNLQAVKSSDVVCLGSNEGKIELTFVDQVLIPTNDAGSFTYTITGTALAIPLTGTSTTAGPTTVSGLSAGLYTATATLINSPYCTATTNFTINQPSVPLAIRESHTAITCATGNNDGSISVTATGGWSGDYQYELVKGGTSIYPYSNNTYYNSLISGSYRVNVKDIKGCISFVDVVLVNPTPLTVTLVPSTTLLICKGDKTATLTATNVTGGQGNNYKYTLNYLSLTPITSSGPQTSPIFTDIAAGTYSVTVTDGWSCSATSTPVTINEPTKVAASLTLSKTPTCLAPAQLTLTATGGTPPYTYSSDGVHYSTVPFNSTVVLNVVSGTYSYLVKDANGCVAFQSNDLKVAGVPTLTIEMNVDNANINCKGDASGVIIAKATGGLGNYVYTLYDGSGNAITPVPVQSEPGRFNGLKAGFYQVRVQSGTDCTEVSGIEEIKEPTLPVTFATPIVTDVTCNAQKDGKVVIIGSGGTGPIKYSISPQSNQFFDDGTFDNLEPGAYQIIVQDQLGCFLTYAFNIVEPPILAASVIPGTELPEICAGDNNAAFSIEVIGGKGPYLVNLDNPSISTEQGIVGQTRFDFVNLAGGVHNVYITDASGCDSELEVVLGNPVILNPTAVVAYDCINNAQSNSVTVTIDGSTTLTDVDYDLDNSGTFQASNVFNNVAAGVHFVTVRHSNTCEKRTANFTVLITAPLTLTVADGAMNEIVATATGGGGGYEYSFNGEPFTTNSKFIIYKSGNYTIIVRDKNGCTATITEYGTVIDVCIPNYFTPNGDGNQDTWAPGCTNIYPDLTFAIFDRYGREVGKYRYGQSWNGKYNGVELPTGDYWYVLKLNNIKDDREFVGHFTLYR